VNRIKEAKLEIERVREINRQKRQTSDKLTTNKEREISALSKLAIIIAIGGAIWIMLWKILPTN